MDRTTSLTINAASALTPQASPEGHSPQGPRTRAEEVVENIASLKEQLEHATTQLAKERMALSSNPSDDEEEDFCFSDQDHESKGKEYAGWFVDDLLGNNGQESDMTRKEFLASDRTDLFAKASDQYNLDVEYFGEDEDDNDDASVDSKDEAAYMLCERGFNSRMAELIKDLQAAEVTASAQHKTPEQLAAEFEVEFGSAEPAPVVKANKKKKKKKAKKAKSAPAAAPAKAKAKTKAPVIATSAAKSEPTLSAAELEVANIKRLETKASKKEVKADIRRQRNAEKKIAAFEDRVENIIATDLSDEAIAGVNAELQVEKQKVTKTVSFLYSVFNSVDKVALARQQKIADLAHKVLGKFTQAYEKLQEAHAGMKKEKEVAKGSKMIAEQIRRAQARAKIAAMEAAAKEKIAEMEAERTSFMIAEMNRRLAVNQAAKNNKTTPDNVVELVLRGADSTPPVKMNRDAES